VGIKNGAGFAVVCAGDARRGIVYIVFFLGCILAKTMPTHIRARADWRLLPKTDRE
jgi:hypothetical protein